jgi:MFS family permease
MLAGSIMTLFLSLGQDIFGRKKLFQFSYALLFFGWFFIVFFRSLILNLIGLMLLWGFMEVSCLSIYNLSNELLVNPLRNHSILIYSMAVCFGGILGNYLTHYLTSYQSLSTAIFFCYSFFYFFVIIFLPESPSILLKQGKHKELKQVIEQISKQNGLSENKLNLILEDLESVIECKF